MKLSKEFAPVNGKPVKLTPLAPNHFRSAPEGTTHLCDKLVNSCRRGPDECLGWIQARKGSQEPLVDTGLAWLACDTGEHFTARDDFPGPKNVTSKSQIQEPAGEVRWSGFTAVEPDGQIPFFLIAPGGLIVTNN